MSSFKVCTGPCKRKLESSSGNFQRDSRKKDGLRARCKACTSSHASVKPSVDADDGFKEIAKSTLRGADGKVVAQWVKTQKAKSDSQEAFLAALKDLDKGWKKPGKIKKPKITSADLCTVIPLGDPHIGLYTWKDETGQDFDLKIAEQNLFTAVDQLVGLAPKAKQALLISLGDLYHADNSYNQTTKGTRVDVDTRWPKVLRVGIRVMRRCIDRLLETHENVRVIIEIGNHDENSAIMLGLALEQFYEGEPRVSIDTSPAKFHYFTWGRTLIGTHHGNGAKFKDLPSIMAVDRAKDWGNSDYRYFYTGHVHHQKVLEAGGVVMESFRTLAPGDAWHRGQGYRSGQELNLDIIHKKYGRINRHVIGINQILDAER